MTRHVRLKNSDADRLAEKRPLAMSLSFFGSSMTDDVPLTIDDLRMVAAARMDLSPRYRQRIMAVPPLPGFERAPAPPVWVDDTDFDLSRHIVPAGPDREISVDEAVDVAADLLATEHFDLDHPPWRIHVIEHIEGGRIGVVTAMHHAAADGMASLAFLTLLIASWEPDRTLPGPPAPWRPEPPPSTLALQAEAIRDRAVGLGRRVRTLGRRSGPSKAAMLTRLPDTFGRLRGHAPTLPYESNRDDPVRLQVWGRPLLALRDAAKVLATTATFNDIVLAALAGGVRAWLRHRSLPIADTRAMLPVNVAERDRTEAGQPSNHLATMISVLPVTEADPQMRLVQVHSRMAESKARGDIEPLAAYGVLLGRLPTRVRRRLHHFVWDRYVRNDMAVSNFPGPPVPLFVRDCPVEAIYPFGTMESRGTALWVTSSAGQAHFSLVTDAGIPDTDLLADAIRHCLDEYVALAERHTAIRAVPGLAPLPDDTLADLANALDEVRVQAGKAVFHEGDPGDTFYLVRGGTLDVGTTDHEHLRTLGPGDSFGEIALVTDSTRTATITATTDARLWALDREHFLTAVKANPTARILTQAIIDTRLANAR